MVSVKTIITIGLLAAFALVLASPQGRKAISEVKKLGADAKSFTQKQIDKIDGKKAESK